MIWALIVILVIVLDQATKFIVEKNIASESSITMIDRFFYLTNIRNTGAAWSMFQGGRYFFIVLTLIVSCAIVYFLYKADNRLLRLILSLILGGALGNWLDRVFRGSVVDFLHFYIGTYSFPVFNVADSFVVVGTFLLAYYMIFVYKENPKEE